MAAYPFPSPRRRDEDRRPKRDEVREVRETLDLHSERLEKMDVALFAPDADNEHGQPGLMHTARRLNAHLDVMCNIAKAAKHIAVATVSGLVALGSVGKAFGWW